MTLRAELDRVLYMDSVRDQAREACFARDGGRCVLCGAPAQDAHHILERRLWPDGGYVLDNLASVCGPCHLRCERTQVTVEEVREAAGIRKVVVPPHMYPDERYDKWGNVVMPGGSVCPGELFNDESVQKALREGGVYFTNLVKYPRTYHLPWSPGMGKDDRVMEDLSVFDGVEVVVTQKMDGENTSLYYDGYVHARSVDGANHPSRSWVKSQWAKVAHELPYAWRVCGENLYAVHSIRYSDLESYLYVFSVWDQTNSCLSWDDTCDWAELLGFPTVPVLYRGVWDEEVVQGLWTDADRERVEGYVVRVVDGFGYREFKTSVAKFVRANHVQTDRHWAAGRRIEVNVLTDA